jgi:hypothetical protein
MILVRSGCTLRAPGGPERRAMHADANEMEGEKTRMIGKVMCRFRRDVRPLMMMMMMMMMIKGRASFLSDEISIMGYSCV